MKNREDIVFDYLNDNNIPYTCYHHPEGKTIEEAKQWWHNDGSMHCKNLFSEITKGTGITLYASIVTKNLTFII